MPIFVNNENDEKAEKATKIFTDRIAPREVFWRNYNLINDAIANQEIIPIQVITYYGIGGVGKSRLLSQIRTEIDEKNNGTKYCYIDFEKLTKIRDDVLSILNAIKAQLNRNYNFEFPLFDMVAYEYNIRSGIEATKPELESMLSKNKELSFLVSVMEEIPLVGTFAKIASLINEGSNVLQKRFKDKKLQSTFNKLDKMDLDEIKSILPYYFAKDLQENIKNEKHPFVFQLDTYERIVNELTVVGNISNIDDWLKGPNGLIRNVSNILWIIAGREKLKWEENDENWKGTLEQHLLGDLSLNDSSYFLKSAGIQDEKIIDKIYKLTSGIPMYLDMCVDTYYKSLEKNNNVQIDDFLGDKTKLIERFFTYMNDQEKDFVTILSFIGNWTDENIETQIKDVLGNFSFNLYEKIKNFSFIIHEGENYKIHETIRNVITENAPVIIKNKFNATVKKKQDEVIEKIEEDSSSLAKESKFNNKTEIKESTTNSENKDNTSVILLENENKKNYSNVIDDIVNEIEEFLYQKPKLNKTSKTEYCNKVSNLLEKIEKYLDLFDVRYDYKKLKTIVDNKLFEQTYEYKRLKGLYIALCRYYNSIGNENCEKFKSVDTINIYKETKNIYKNKNEKLKQLSYILRILGTPNYTLANQEDFIQKLYYRNSYFTAYELRLYKEIFIKNNLNNNENIEYLILLYTKRDIKEFNSKFEKFFDKNKETDNIKIKRFLVNYTLAFLFEEFKGKPGKGYLFNNYKMTKLAEQEYTYKNLQFVSYKQKKQYIDNYIKNRKNQFINLYLGKVIDIINKDKRLINVSTLNTLISVIHALYDENTSDELKLKLYNMLLEFKYEILNTNNLSLIEAYNNLIFNFSKFYNLYDITFINNNREIFNNLELQAIDTLQDIKNKYIEIFGKYDFKVNEQDYNYSANLYLHYNKFAEIIKYYNYAEWYKKHIIHVWNTEIKKITNYNKIPFKLEDLIEVQKVISEDFKNNVQSFFDYFTNFNNNNLNDNEEIWNLYVNLSTIIFYKTHDPSYLDFYFNSLKEISKEGKEIKSFNIYKKISNDFSLIYELFNDLKNYSCLERAINFYYEIFSVKIPDFMNNTIYTKENYRNDLIKVAVMILIKISYDEFLNDNEKNVFLNYEYMFEDSRNVMVRSNYDSKNNNLELFDYIIGLLFDCYKFLSLKFPSSYVKAKKLIPKSHGKVKEFASLINIFEGVLFDNNCDVNVNKFFENKINGGLFKNKNILNKNYYIMYKKIINLIEFY